MKLDVTEAWRAAHAGACIGLLELSGVDNTRPPASLDDQKRATEARVRAQYAGLTRPDFSALPVMSAYVRYYKRFGKTYHVQLQLESIVLKGKRLPDVSPLVDANFMAEIDTLVLTAGHDAARLHGYLSLDVSRAGDQIVQMNGALKAMPEGDMVMRDGTGVCCSIIYGQDDRSPITPATSHVLYVAYGPAGVSAEAVEAQLRLVDEHVRLFAPAVVVEQRRVVSA
jgi:DNA/RNA-binding domain of Phe-tRNA-synthetase-like protein